MKRYITQIDIKEVNIGLSVSKRGKVMGKPMTTIENLDIHESLEMVPRSGGIT